MKKSAGKSIRRQAFSDTKDMRKRCEAKQGRVIKAASRWHHLQDMKLLPKSPLDSSPLGRGIRRGRGYFEESDPKPELFSEKEQRGKRERGRIFNKTKDSTRKRTKGLGLGLGLRVKG